MTCECGAFVEWYWHGKTSTGGQAYCNANVSPKAPQGVAWSWVQASAMRDPTRRVWSHGTASSGSTDWLVVCSGCLRLWYEQRLGCWRSGAEEDKCERRLEELHDLQSSPNIRVIKSRRMRRAEHVARIEEKGNIYTRVGGKTWRKESAYKT
jgi:hypothetical protein